MFTPQTPECFILILVDANPRWTSEHPFDSSNGLLGTYRCTDSLLWGKQRQRVLRFWWDLPVLTSIQSNKLTTYIGMDHFLSKPIRRPALKQVLKQFATIPEETETSSGKSTPSEHDATSRELSTPATSSQPEGSTKPHLPVNGITPPPW